MKTDFLIRRFDPCEWETFKSIRLEALQTNPPVFGASYGQEAAEPDSFWLDALTSSDRAVFGLFYKNDVIGLTGVRRFQQSPADTVILTMSFVRPAYRGLGLSTLLYQARLDWARAQGGITRVIVSHRDGNDASRAANQKWGFSLYHVGETAYGDGSSSKDYRYELILK